MSAQRYDLHSSVSLGMMIPRPDGEWVEYATITALEAEVARLREERDWWKLLFIAAKHTHTATRHLELRCTDSTSDGTLWHVVEVNHKRKTETPRMVMDADGRGQPPMHRPEYVEALGRIVDTFRGTAIAPAARKETLAFPKRKCVCGSTNVVTNAATGGVHCKSCYSHAASASEWDAMVVAYTEGP